MAEYQKLVETESGMSTEEPPSRHKKRLKSSFARANSAVYTVQNLRVTNKCLALRLGSMRERLQKVHKHNKQLRKQNSELRDQIRELKQNPMLNKFTDIKEHIEELKNKVFLLHSNTSGAVKTVVDLSKMCLSGKSTEPCVRSSLTTTFSSIPYEEVGGVSAYQSRTDAACSVFDDSESTFKMAFPDGDRASPKQRSLHHTYFKKKLCLSSSEDVSALSRELLQTSKSASSAYISGNELVYYFEKFKYPDACLHTTSAQYQQRKNNDSIPKDQTLEPWMDAAKCHEDEIISDNEMLLLKSVNSCDDEQQESGCNIKIAPSNSPKLTDVPSSPVKKNRKRNVGRCQRNKPKSKTLRKDNNPVIIPYTGNLRTSKTVMKATVPTLKRSPLCSGKTKFKKSDDINPTTNETLNSKLSPPACSKNKINIEPCVFKSKCFKLGRPEHTKKAPLFGAVASTVPKSQKFRKDSKICRKTSRVCPKTRPKLGKQKLPEHVPLFLTAEKRKLDCVLSMRADELTFPISSLKNENETVSNNYETFSVDMLSKISSTISSRKVQLGENLAHGLRLKDNSNSTRVDSHSKLQAHATRSNAWEASNNETNEDAYDTMNSGSATLVSQGGVKIDNPQCADDDFQKRCIENSADNVKPNALSVTMSTDCSNGWVITKDGLNSDELRKCNDFKQSENEQYINSRENPRSPVKDAIIKKHNQNSMTQKQMNIYGKNKDKRVFTSIPGTSTRQSKSSCTRPRSAMLETKRSFEGKEIKGDVSLFSCPNACKINKLSQNVKRPHSVGSTRSKTKLFDYERIMKTKPTTRAKSPFKPINMPHDERQRMNTRGERKTSRANLISPCLPIKESNLDTTTKNKTGTRSMSPPGIIGEMHPDSMTESLAIASIETHELTQSTATVESTVRQRVI